MQRKDSELRGEPPYVINKLWRVLAIHDAKILEVDKQDPQCICTVPFDNDTQQHFLLESPLKNAIYSYQILTQSFNQSLRAHRTENRLP